MPGTPDDLKGGTTDVDLLIVNDSGADPMNIGEFTRNGTVLKARDGLGVFNLRDGGTGFNEDSMLIDRATAPIANRAGNLLRNQS